MQISKAAKEYGCHSHLNSAVLFHLKCSYVIGYIKMKNGIMDFGTEKYGIERLDYVLTYYFTTKTRYALNATIATAAIGLYPSF